MLGAAREMALAPLAALLETLDAVRAAAFAVALLEVRDAVRAAEIVVLFMP